MTIEMCISVSMCTLWRDSLYSDDQQFSQYQQNEQSPLDSSNS